MLSNHNAFAVLLTIVPGFVPRFNFDTFCDGLYDALANKGKDVCNQSFSTGESEYKTAKVLCPKNKLMTDGKRVHGVFVAMKLCAGPCTSIAVCMNRCCYCTCGYYCGMTTTQIQILTSKNL